MKLERKHLCAYLPHDLKIMFEGDDNVHSLVGVDITDRGAHVISPYNDYGHARIEDCMPVLRPLSDLTKPITHNGETFVPIERLKSLEDYVFGDDAFLSLYWMNMPYEMCEMMLSWHFDIWGLLDAGLAIDLNTVNQ